MDSAMALLPWQAIFIILLAAFSTVLVWQVRSLRQQQAHCEDEAPSSLRLACNQTHNVYVRDIMSRNLITLTPDDTAQIAWHTLQQKRIKTIPVVSDGRVRGIISLVDLLKHLGLAWHTLPEDLTARANIIMAQDVATLMSKPVRTVPADMPLAELAPLLSDTGLRHLPVVDARGQLVGMVTQSDLIAGLAHLLNGQTAAPDGRND